VDKGEKMLKAPFPYFGGKSKASELIWSRLGTDIKAYIEPFYGSGAVWLNRPKDCEPTATMNDKSGHVANFWRAVEADPEAVAMHADRLVNECDLHARHLYLVRSESELSSRLMADPFYFDAQIAGWWAWGACTWIGGGWCGGNGPWTEIDGLFVKKDAGKGVNRQLPHLGDAGQGVNRPIAQKDNDYIAQRQEWLKGWFRDLQNALRGVRFACGDWSRIMAVPSIKRFGIAGILLDPPYSQTEAVYAHDSNTIAHDVREWCIKNGDDPELRIALCGHEGEHNELELFGWSVDTWAKGGGYQGTDDRERIWFSPHCLKDTDQIQMSLF
jgi:DNA adenine methylase